MRNRVEFLVAVGFAVLLLALSSPAIAQTGPTVSGAVRTEQPSGSVALSKALVELVSPGDQEGDQVVKRAYTDSSGEYVFRNVSAGTYALRVSLGRQLLYQKAGQRFARKQLLRVGSKSMRMPTIIVRGGDGESESG